MTTFPGIEGGRCSLCSYLFRGRYGDRNGKLGTDMIKFGYSSESNIIHAALLTYAPGAPCQSKFLLLYNIFAILLVSLPYRH